MIKPHSFLWDFTECYLRPDFFLAFLVTPAFPDRPPLAFDFPAFLFAFWAVRELGLGFLPPFLGFVLVFLDIN